MEIKASDRTYEVTKDGNFRVLDYSRNGAENSEIYSPKPIKNRFSGKVAEKYAQAQSVPVVQNEEKTPLEERLAQVLVDNPNDAPVDEVKDAEQAS